MAGGVPGSGVDRIGSSQMSLAKRGGPRPRPEEFGQVGPRGEGDEGSIVFEQGFQVGSSSMGRRIQGAG